MMPKSTLWARILLLPLFAILGVGLPCRGQAADVATASTASRPYLVNAGDEIEVYVWGEERLQRSVRVLPDGSFSFPLVGKVEAAGKSPEQLASIVSKGLEPGYRGEVPQVTVSIKAATGLQFSVAGHVRTPGTFTPGRYVNLLEALSLAGGPDEFANLDNIAIIRKQGSGVVTIRARMAGVFRGAIREGEAAAIPELQGGDAVIVP